MPKMLNDGAVEYEDGTPATEAQVILLFISLSLTLNVGSPISTCEKCLLLLRIVTLIFCMLFVV